MTISRIQLALNVTDINAATRFYTDLFAVEPAKLLDQTPQKQLSQQPLLPRTENAQTHLEVLL